MMATLTFELAGPDDAGALAELSRRSFDTDIECGGSGSGGPPGYDSPTWQVEMMRMASAYWKIMLDGRLIGGAIVFCYPRGRYYLARIFLDPDYHRQGWGLRSMEHLMASYPEARSWRLETPPWNTRTLAFYEKLGFRILRQTDDSVFYRLDIAAHDA